MKKRLGDFEYEYKQSVKEMEKSNTKEQLKEAQKNTIKLVNDQENDTKRFIDVEAFKSHTKSEYDKTMERMKEKVRKEIETGCDLIRKSKDEGQIDKNMKELDKKIDEQFKENSKETEPKEDGMDYTKFLKNKVKKAA